MRFKNKVIMITGAASGIGLACAKLFGAEGGRVVLLDIDEPKVVAAAKSLREAGAPEVFAKHCDISNYENVKASFKESIAKFGRVDVVVNNAGLMVFKKLEDQTPADWNKVIQVDLMGTFYFIQQAFVHMKNGGAIVNVSSVHAVETTPLVSSYAAAKAAVLSLTRSAAIEGKAKGIRVNAILPGAVDTPMLWENPNIKAGLEVINQSDVGQPAEIAEAIAFLASDESSFIQGTSLRVDGGRLARL